MPKSLPEKSAMGKALRFPYSNICIIHHNSNRFDVALCSKSHRVAAMGIFKSSSGFSRFNFGLGLLLTSLDSLPTLMVIIGNHRNSSFIPTNHWLWWAFLGVLVCSYAFSIVALLRKTGWGYCAWFQAVISFMVLIVYIGWWRREMEYIQGPHDPELNSAPPDASWPAYLVILLITLTVSLLPIGIRTMVRLVKKRKERLLPKS